jgi:hypothetical protein
MANPTGRGGFKTGKRGNPGGWPRQLASVMHEARRHTFEAIHTLLKLMRAAESESVRLRAAEAILNRGWGLPIQALQLDGRFLTKKLTDLTTDEIRALEARVEMIEPDQGVLALTDRTESTKCEPKLSREEGALAHAQVTAAAPSRNSPLRGNRMGDLAARIRRRQAV